MPKFEDVTSYAKGEKKVPRAWEVVSGDIRITVLKDPNNWTLNWTFEPDEYLPLKATDVEKAKVEAVAYVRKKLDTALAEVKEVTP